MAQSIQASMCVCGKEGVKINVASHYIIANKDYWKTCKLNMMVVIHEKSISNIIKNEAISCQRLRNINLRNTELKNRNNKVSCPQIA